MFMILSILAGVWFLLGVIALIAWVKQSSKIRVRNLRVTYLGSIILIILGGFSFIWVMTNEEDE